MEGQKNQGTHMSPCLTREQGSGRTPILTREQGINTQQQVGNEKYCLNCQQYGHDAYGCPQPGCEKAFNFLQCQEELFEHYKQVHTYEQLQRLDAIETAHKMINPTGKYWDRGTLQRQDSERNIPSELALTPQSTQVGVKRHPQWNSSQDPNQLAGHTDYSHSDSQVLTPQTPSSPIDH